MLDEPSSSLAARIYSVFMLIVIAVSIINFCISTYPEDLCMWVDTEGKSLVGSSDGVQRTCSYRRFEDYDSPEIIETVCIMLFTAEYLLRALCCGTMMSFWRFLIEPLNILDLLAILPWYITTIMLAVTLSGGGEQDKSKVGQVMLRENLCQHRPAIDRPYRLLIPRIAVAQFRERPRRKEGC